MTSTYKVGINLASHMQNGLTTSRGGVRYVSSMIQLRTGTNYSKVLLPGSLLHV